MDRWADGEGPVRYAAFLRGINLGGRRVTGPQLCAPFTALGFADARSFLASGNVAFEVPGTDDPPAGDELEPLLEAELEAALGFEVEVFVRTADEVAAIVAAEPFPPEVIAASTGKLQVSLHRSPPSDEDAAAVLAHASDEDQLAVIDRELYWLPAGPMSASALDLAAIARILGRGTMRTANTLARLHAKHLAAS